MGKIIIGVPFVPHVDQNKRPELPLSYIEKLFSKFHSQIHDVLRTGIFKSMGYAYDFRPFCKKFLYKQHGDWTEVYAPNKTVLRRCVYGKIDKIVEI